MSSNKEKSVLDTELDFFEGDAQFVSGNQDVTRFKLVGETTVIDVRNSLHTRGCVSGSSTIVSILAPLFSVELVEGELPLRSVKKYSAKYYQNKNSEYIKDIPTGAAETAYTVDNYFKQNGFSKDTLDCFFCSSQEDLKDLANHKSQKYGLDVEIIKNNDGLTMVAYQNKILIYATNLVLDKKTKLTKKVLHAEFFPIGTLPEEKKVFYKDKLNGSTCTTPEHGYSVLFTFESKEDMDVLTSHFHKTID